MPRSDTNQKLRLIIVPFTGLESLLHRERGISVSEQSLAGFVATEVKVFGESSEILAFLFMEKVRCTALSIWFCWVLLRFTNLLRNPYCRLKFWPSTLTCPFVFTRDDDEILINFMCTVSKPVDTHTHRLQP